MTTENQIAVLAPSERAAVGLNSTKTEIELRALVAASADIVEVKDKAGRQQVHAAAMALRTRWADIDKIGKELRDDANKFSAAVIEEAKRLTDIIKPEGVRLIALRDGFDAEQERIAAEVARKEAARKADHEAGIAGIFRILTESASKTAAEVLELRDYVADCLAGDEWEEYKPKAAAAYAEVLDNLEKLYQTKLAAEEAARAAAEAAEVERLRQIAERETLAIQKAQQEAESKRLAALAAELEAMAKVAADAEAANAANMKAEQDRITAANKREADDLAAQRAAFEAQQRAAQQAKEDAAKLEADHAEALAMDAAWAAPVADTRPVIAIETYSTTFTEAEAAILAEALTPAALPTLRLGMISERLTFTVNAALLSSLGFEPSGKDKAAVLFHEHQFPAICDALNCRIVEAKMKWVAA